MKTLVLLCLFFFPFFAQAQVVISEIMYDLEGSDAGREWIEVYNAGADAVDLSSWRLFENESNHKLSLSLGSAILAPGTFAIIADNANLFLEENTGFLGTVFDSSFSLKNSAETLVIRDANLDDIDSVTYNPDIGAAGDGNSLTLQNGVWVAIPPTPGEGSMTSDDAIGDDVDDTAPAIQTNLVDSEKEITAPQKRAFITVNAGKDRTMVVGAAEFFEADAYKQDGSENLYVSYTWNFGNGMVRDGKKVLHQYNYPGKYAVWVSGVTADQSDRLSSTDRITVSVEPVDLFISSVRPDAIALTNNSGRELNLTLWSLRAGSAYFMFPLNTILLPHTTVYFPSRITNLDSRDPNLVALLYPNGIVKSVYAQEMAKTFASAPVNIAPMISQSSASSIVEETSSSSTFVAGLIPEAGNHSIEEAQIASVASSLKQSGGNLYVYLLALLIILGSAIIAVLVLGERSNVIQESTVENSTQLSAHDFTIIEKKEE
ncbi:MAG TPA: lamin tail domain-containing protein [Candidatus Paceibacterota bacterium]